jgi:PX domain-containing protein kinase-like protein
MQLRSTTWEFKRSLPDIGCRQLKYFFEADSWSSDKAGAGIMSLTRVSKKSRTEVKWRQFMINVLKGVNHPNIDKPVDVTFMPDATSVLVTRKIYKRGSIRDHLYDAVFQDDFVKKYYKTAPKPFKEESIASIGRQIIEALIYLQAQGIPYTHLSAGNVMITSGGVARLTETENAFLVLERFYEHIFREFSDNYPAAFILADINVLALGCVLYEMSTALPVHKLEDLDNLALGLPELSEIIRKIFHADGKNTFVPTLAELAAEPFFAKAKIPKAARTASTGHSSDLDASQTVTKRDFNWTSAEKTMMSELVRLNSKLIFPDDERLYMATVTSINGTATGNQTQSTHHQLPRQMGGFTSVPKPSRTKKTKSERSSTSKSSTHSANSSQTYSTPSTPSTPSKNAVVAPVPSAGPVPPPPPPPARATPSPPPGGSAQGKTALLSSITGFNASALKKTVTVDKSGPKF